MALSLELPFMLPGIMATLLLSAALSTVAHTIKLWADLKIPEYDNTGKIVGYKTIDSTAFTTAADNIKTVLTTLFDAIKEVYDNDKSGIFGVGGWSGLGTFLLTGKSPAERVIMASMKMGKMLSNIADGIKDWAKLRIPEYGKDGKIIGYKTIDNSAFADAAENIKSVIICLGQAIIDTYESAPDMFESKEWFGLGNTPFAKVTKALKTMGPMLSSIASGVKDWAELKIPIYKKGENGPKIVDYKYLDYDALKDAQKNIVKVVSTLAEGVLQVYEKNPDMFDDDSWLGLNHTPFAIVCRSLKTMGSALGNIADAVQAWADLKIPVYGNTKDLTKITEYKTIDNGIFKTVSRNIRYVVTMLANSIASLAQGELGSLFTEEDFWSGKTPVQKVLKSIQPMGSALKDIADAIEAWSSLKIPKYNDKKNPTKISGYKQLSLQDITNAQENMSLVIKGLIEGIAKVYNMKDENGFEYKTLFDSTGALFWKSDSPIVKVLNAINPIGKALKNIGDALKAWAELKIPIYDGQSIEPKSYMSIGGVTGINEATDNIQKVLRAMIKAVASVYYGKIVIGKGEPLEYQKLFKDDDKSIINLMTEQMSKVAELISKAAKGVQDIANLKIPVYNSKGKIIKYNNIEDGTFDKVGTVIATVLTAIGKAIINVATDPLLDTENNPNFKAAVEAIKYSTDILSSIAGIVANYATGKFVVYEVKNGKLVPTKTIDITKQDVISNFKTNIETVLIAIGETLKTMLGKNNGLNVTENDKKQLEHTKTVIVTLTKSIGETYKSIGELNKVFKENEEAINELIKKDETTNRNNFAVLLGNIISSLNDISDEILFKSNFMENISKISENKQNLITNMNNTYAVLNNLLAKLSKLANDNNKLKNADFTNISSIITKFVSALSSINANIGKSEKLSYDTSKKIKSLIKDSENLVNLLNKFVDIIKISASINNESYDNLSNSIIKLYTTIKQVDFEGSKNIKFTLFTSLLDEYIKVVSKFDITTDQKANSLENGILNIYNITKAIDTIEKFKNHTKDLEKYIAAINNIDLSRINGLKTLVDSINQLSMRLGNLDNLTNAISDKLSAVLLELVNQLRKAELTIKNAHELQEYRKKLIEKSIETVKSLMDKPMTVEISQKSEDDTDSNKPDGYIDSNPINPSIPQGTDNEAKEDNSLNLENAENAEFKQSKSSNNDIGIWKDKDVLTMTEFKALMEANMKGWGEK